jgi:O-antigen ligase
MKKILLKGPWFNDAASPATRAFSTAIGTIAATGTIEGYVLPWVVLPAFLIAGVYAGREQTLWFDRSVAHRASGLIGFVLLCLASAVWAISAGDALRQAAILGCIAATAIVVHSGLQTATEAQLRHNARWLLVGLAVGLAYLTFECLTGLSIRKAIDAFNARPIRYPSAYMIAESWRLNRAVATLGLLFWPALLIAIVLFPKRIVSIALVAATALVVYALNHKTSKLALLCSAVVFFLAYWQYAAARKLVIAVWIALTLLIVPIAAGISTLPYRDMHWLTPTVQARVAIWHRTIKEISKHPVLGIGAGNHRALVKQFAAEEQARTDHFSQHLNHHPHSTYLLVWLELGLIHCQRHAVRRVVQSVADMVFDRARRCIHRGGHCHARMRQAGVGVAGAQCNARRTHAMI